MTMIPEPSSLEDFEEFCRVASRSDDAASVSALADALRPGGRILRFEGDLARLTIQGLIEKFHLVGVRDLWPHKDAWLPAVDEVFTTIERMSDHGARRALFASFARLMAPGLSADDVCSLGPIHCGVFEMRRPRPMKLPEGADAAIVRITDDGLPVAIVELPALFAVSLGDALEAAPGPALRKLLVSAHGLSGKGKLARMLILAAWKSFASSGGRGDRKQVFKTSIKRAYHESLRSMTTPILAPSDVRLPQTSSARSVGETLPAIGRVPVLMYHRILARDEELDSPFSNTIESFKRQLDVLKQLGVQSISSDQLVDATSRRSLPDRPV
ncbi:MAG: hypothetical protein JWN07_1958, partial [Hyphomicrobiales bacterium]|nr:hypothetical protein [Hyphomicrobiales bacterium]